jgi:hypothetical protein
MPGPDGGSAEQFGGGFASPEDIRVMEQLAYGILGNTPYEENKAYQYQAVNGLIASFGTCVYEDESYGSEANITLAAGEQENTKLHLVFGYNNELLHLAYPSEEDIPETSQLLQDMLEQETLEALDTAVLRHVLSILSLLTDGDQLDKLSSQLPTPTGQTKHIADVVRDQTAIHATKIVRTREAMCRLKDRYEITAFSSETYPKPLGLDEESLTLLQIELSDWLRKKTYLYSLNSDNTNSLLTEDFVYTDKEVDWTQDDSDTELEDIMATWGAEMGMLAPRKADVELIIKNLMEAVFMEATGELQPAQDSWAYPRLAFGFDFPQELLRRDQTGESLAQLVDCTLRSLALTEKYQLPERCPEGFPPQPNYAPTPNKRNRLYNYLNEKVTVGSSGRPERLRRMQVVNIQQAALHVLDGLASQDHPVSQMVAQLHEDYAPVLGEAVVQDIATEVVMLTHWGKVRAALVGQIAGSRIVPTLRTK